MRQSIRLFFAGFVLCLISTWAAAQTPTGSVEGIIADQSKAVVFRLRRIAQRRGRAAARVRSHLPYPPKTTLTQRVAPKASR